MPFVEASDLLFFGGGAREIARRLRDNEVLPDVAATVVVREPSLGDAYFMFDAKDFLEAVREVLDHEKEPSAETVLAALELASSEPVDVRRSPRTGSPASVVVRDGRFEGVWLPDVEPDRVVDLADVPRMRDLPARLPTLAMAPRRLHEWRDRVVEPAIVHADSFASGRDITLAPGGAPGIVERTPHMDAPDEIAREAGTRFEVAVRVDTAGFAPGEEGERLRIEWPDGVDSIPIGVLLTTTRHFEIESQPLQEMTIARDEAAAGPVKFALRVAKRAPRGVAGISAVFIHNLRPSGRVERTWSWTGRGKVAKARTGEGEVRTGPTVRVDDEQPDVSILITGPVENERRFQCAVMTHLVPGYPREARDWVLPSRAHDFVKEELAKFSRAGATPEKRRRSLNAAGRAFWAAAPEAFKTLLRDAEEAGNPPETIHIHSIEPSMPWELITPGWANADGVVEWRKPIGATYAVSRWVRKDDVPARLPSPIATSVLVAPEYKGERALDSSAERKLLSSRLGGKAVPKATLDEVDDFLEASDASLLHFACHGEVTDDGEILELEDDDLLAAELPDFDGIAKFCARHPLVFLNACDTGQQSESLLGGAGFPLAFGEMGASGVIAPLWAVDDGVASTVAVELYTRALDDPRATIPAILRDLRLKAYDEEAPQDSYAAYAFYGDPFARIERRS